MARPERLAARLAEADVRARVLGDRLRIGVHGFNDVRDIERVLAAIRAA